MAKKRKSVATRLDEVDRNMYGTFCTAANSLSQLYSAAVSQQRHSFQAGERHALEKLYQWIITKEEESTVNTRDILAYLQNQIDYGSEGLMNSPRLPHNNYQPTNSAIPVLSSDSIPFEPVVAGQYVLSGSVDQQTKNSVFSNALSGPVRHHVHQYQLAQDVLPSGMDPQSNNNTHANLQRRESNSYNSNSMDMQ